MRDVREFLKRNLAWLVIVGALLDVLVFGFQLQLASNQANLNAQSACWFGVLDQAVSHPKALTKAQRAQLTAEAYQCAQLRPVGPVITVPSRTRG